MYITSPLLYNHSIIEIIGASVTSATLCDGIIASENASFLTPFNRLGIPPEGCSSVHFDRIMNKDLAYKMLHEDLQVYSHQAKEAGFVLDVVPESKLQFRAQQIAEEWILMNKKRIVAPDLKQVNEKESELLATAFLSPPFLYGQYKFLRSKGKIQLALIFWLLSLTQPLWSMLLQKRK
jgi:enoyl-CoA hydratase/carnithine racemase